MRCLLFVLLASIMVGIPATAKDKARPATAAAVEMIGDAAGAYFLPAAESSSAALASHSGTGLHAAFVGFGEENGDILYYAQCSRGDCTEERAWSRVELAMPRAVKAQIAVTPDGRPRIFGAGWSDQEANGTDYYYAECDRDCLVAANWRIGKIVSTADGLLSNISRNRLPERNFALDRNGNPRFLVADSNYHIEPDHYGGFFMSCDRGCTDPANWTETNLANQHGYNTESFSYAVLKLGTDGSAHVVANVYAFDTDGTDLDDGLYYYRCAEDCAERGNWARTRLLYPGSGTYPNPTWSLDLADDKPRLAVFTGYGSDGTDWERKLLYAWCDSDCTAADGLNWYAYPIGERYGVGESPSLVIDAKGLPHMAYTDDGYELLYATCQADCENPDGAGWVGDFAERSETAAANRPTALPYTCDGEVWNGMQPTIVLVAERPMIAYDLSVEARCLYQEMGQPEITYQFHEIWRGSRVVRPPIE